MTRPPECSVVIPVYNGAATLGVQLQALVAQVGAPPFEVIVADNGSTDGTREIAEAFVGRLDLRIIDASAERGPSHARNRGTAAARSAHLLFCDADDRVGPAWVAGMHQALSRNALVTGPVLYVDRAAICGADLPPRSSHPTAPRCYFGQVPFAPSNNLAIRRQLFEDLQGFDPALRSCQDADLTIRAQMDGEVLGWAPDAVVLNARRATLRAASRQFFRYGYYDALVYRKLRGRALAQRSPWEMLRPYVVLATTPHRLLLRRRRWSWVVNAAQRAGRLAGSVRFRVLCL